MYQVLFWPILRRLPPELAHRLSFWALRWITAFPGARWMLHRFLGSRHPALRVRALGLEFPGPLGLAAGFDKDAYAPDALCALGFGFVEVGTVTAQPQPGNPKPRLFRLPADRALLNRMGFNNAGSFVIAGRLRRLRQRHPGLIIGVNIGKTKTVPAEEAVADYVTSARRLTPYADYLVVNVSSPNTEGLRDLQAVSTLRPLLRAVRMAMDKTSARRVPLLVKISPDLGDEEIDAIADLAIELALDGIVATNTTISRDGLRTDTTTLGAGGVSGLPLRPRALQVLRRLRARVGEKMVLIATGGVADANDAWERLQAGATLVQSYTELIYSGPLWASRLHLALLGMMIKKPS